MKKHPQKSRSESKVAEQFLILTKKTVGSIEISYGVRWRKIVDVRQRVGGKKSGPQNCFSSTTGYQRL